MKPENITHRRSWGPAARAALLLLIALSLAGCGTFEFGVERNPTPGTLPTAESGQIEQSETVAALSTENARLVARLATLEHAMAGTPSATTSTAAPAPSATAAVPTVPTRTAPAPATRPTGQPSATPAGTQEPGQEPGTATPAACHSLVTDRERALFNALPVLVGCISQWGQRG